MGFGLPWALAGLVAIALGYYTRRHADPLYNVYMTKGVAILSLGLAAQFSGATLTTWLAVHNEAMGRWS